VFHPSPKTLSLTVTKDNVARVFPNEPETPRASQVVITSSSESDKGISPEKPARRRPPPEPQAHAQPMDPVQPQVPELQPMMEEDIANLLDGMDEIDDSCFDNLDY